MTQVSTNRQFPGMGDSGIEFFISEKETKFIQHGQVLPFAELPIATVNLLQEAIRQDPQVNAELRDMHPSSPVNRIEQFARCRFGGLDFVGDIVDEKLQEGEYHDCPKRGNCKSNGILCKLPSYNGQTLSTLDVQLMQQLSTSKTIEAIIYEMDIRPGTFHKIHNILYSKLGVQTRQEVTKIAYLLNLIQL
jgi:DNA-binding CsgD family transcriptional regulator